LVHLLRNSADHGIETPSARLGNGKPAAGTIFVRASNEGSSVVISISDDGRGLDRNAIRTRAVRAGLVSEDEIAEMPDAQIYEFIFHPGFSTAETVTSVSGRGVGLDLVQNTIRTLRGSLTVESAENVGTSFHLRLPASVLVSRGILVESGQEEYIIPVESIRDLVRVDAHELRQYRDTRLAVIAGHALPILLLSELLGGQPSHELAESLPVAVMGWGATPFGLVVDRFKGEVQAVIQPLKSPFAGFEICVGAAILGNGRVVLVLDAAELSARAFPVDRALVSEESLPAPSLIT
jgi:two-component system chemotaxis sensor kinase CheA